MRRYFESLRPVDRSAIDSVPNGLFLVRVERAQYRWHAQKPYYSIRFAVLEPRHLAGCLITGRLYCTARAMWKLTWFLRDFGYDIELLGKDEIDDQALLGLKGVLKVSHAIVHGISVLNWTALPPRLVGKNSHPMRRIIFPDLRWRDDLQLHPDQPISDLPAALSPPLPGRL